MVVEQVVHDAVAELRGPHLARLGAGDGKADTAAGAVAAVQQLGVQVAQVALYMLLELARAGGVALVLAAVDVGLKQGV